MTEPLDSSTAPERPAKARSAGSQTSPLRRAIWRGSAIIAPPLVTLVLLIWVGSAIDSYVLIPLESTVRSSLVWAINDIRDVPPAGAVPIDANDPEVGFEIKGVKYVRAPAGERYIPEYIRATVDSRLDRLPTDLATPRTARNYYEAYVTLTLLPRSLTIPVFLLVLLTALYVVGRFFAFGLGRMIVTLIERIIHRLPIVRNIYSSVKQVTDFVLSDRDLEFTRVVLVEYPRVGVWSIAFVTGDGIPQLSGLLSEEVVSAFIPASPVPMTGFTIVVRKRDIIDLDMSVDQAVQFLISCGVVCPPAAAVTLRAHGMLLPPVSDAKG
ncbi:MAG: DUF502 domain-containing protein [Pirellulales bacterium]